VGRDGSGGVPVDGDPVGMMLDVSDTGGATVAAATAARPELVTNGTFDSDTSGWTVVAGNFASVSGEGVLTYEGSSATVSQQVSVTAGKVYKVTGQIISASSASPRLKVGSSAGANDYAQIQAAGEIDLVFVATSSVISFYVQALAAGNAVVDNISVKEISSHAAIAPSDSARPNLASYNSPISSREVLTTTYGWNITDGGRA
jgi:hypothetical protein